MQYIQTMLKLRRVKKKNCPSVGNPENSMLPPQEHEQITHATSVVPKKPLPVSHIIREKVPIDRLIMKFERWRQRKSNASRGTANDEQIQGNLSG